ncbi:MAG: hypothetical protein HYX69_12270 [Planctomycetia bacterium]|nr:hypothetical protein [Planctomycetia bacterium]
MSTKTRVLFFSVAILNLLASAVLADEAAGQAADASGAAGSAPPSKTGSLVLGVAHDPAAHDRLRDRAGRLLGVVVGLDEFQCRVSSECLDRTLSAPFALDAPFQDVLLEIPVHGQAHVQGVVKTVLVPDVDHAAFDMVLAGTVILKGVGNARSIQITSDATTEFHAAARLLLDARGLASQPAACTAKTALVTKEITSSRPKVLGKFTERIAQNRAATNKTEAEVECSAHVEQAICRAFDREIAGLAAAINAALADRLAALDEAKRARWNEVRFRTDSAGISIGRPNGAQALLVAWPSEAGKPVPPIVLRLPRPKLDMGMLTTGLRLLAAEEKSTTGTVPASSSPLFAARPPVAYRSTVSLQPETLTVRLEFEPQEQLAKDQPTGGMR